MFPDAADFALQIREVETIGQGATIGQGRQI